MNIIKLFLDCRGLGLNIGLGELIDGIRLYDNLSKTRDSVPQLKSALRSLWCKSPSQGLQFELAFSNLEQQKNKVDGEADSKIASEPAHLDVLDLGSIDEFDKRDVNQNPIHSVHESQQSFEDSSPFGTLPFSAFDLGLDQNDEHELHSYTPLSRRSMSYHWRYLRNWEFDGARTVLDIDATIKALTKEGTFSGPKFKRKKINHAKLLLLVDRNGSMTPFHRYVNDMVATAISDGGLVEAEVFYFHNVFHEFLYVDHYLLEKTPTDFVINTIDARTSILFLSDAGSARGSLSLQRSRQTLRLLRRIRQHTNLISWINPMPTPRWTTTTASVISQFVPMFQMDMDGLSNAIDILRGVR